MHKKTVLLTFILFSLSFIFSQENDITKLYEKYYQRSFVGIGNLKYFEESYPDVIFERHYKKEKDDWIITIKVPKVPGKKDPDGKRFDFYWANGKFLPESELKNKDNYWSLLTYYPRTIKDPETYTESQIEAIQIFSSEEKREQSKGTPMFFFDAIYDTKTRGSTETHIKRITFLNKHTNVHERIVEPMKRVEEKIKIAAQTDKEVKDFISSIKTYDSYAWREIRGTGRRSFHSLGLATDIMPRYLRGKHIFWSWTKDKYPTAWMTLPLSKRWMPPQKVIDIFESEGFVWGGKWVIYDNMHFEYHPELIKYNDQDNLFPQTTVKNKNGN